MPRRGFTESLGRGLALAPQVDQIDAKRASGSGSFYDISGADRFTQNVKIPEIVAQAQRQLNAAGGQGFKGIRWEVADPNVAQQVQTLFAQRGIRIQVVHTPGN